MTIVSFHSTLVSNLVSVGEATGATSSQILLSREVARPGSQSTVPAPPFLSQIGAAEHSRGVTVSVGVITLGEPAEPSGVLGFTETAEERSSSCGFQLSVSEAWDLLTG
jgi:hypothetical protein